ncbi:MAG TPA: hypothetical protein VGO04_23780 [Ensifer sp.]|jgi:hypothetical protein|uniref:hypothetical protein n=1 Tax=Ensifer sp. TaxID=1872086 RepID=UPI002E0D3B6F|nr:hypothetical protein [Ensifer sp.]
MRQDSATTGQRIVSRMKLLWTVSIITATTVIGAHSGWEGHGIVGALALGFVGLVAGAYLSSPSLLLQLLT